MPDAGNQPPPCPDDPFRKAGDAGPPPVGPPVGRTPSYGYGGGVPVGRPPENYLAWSILTTVLIVAIHAVVTIAAISSGDLDSFDRC